MIFRTMHILLIYREAQFRNSMSKDIYSALKVCGYTITKMHIKKFLPACLKEYNFVIQLLEGPDKVRITQVLEGQGIPYGGNTSQAIAFCNDKMGVKEFLLSQHISTPPGFLVKTQEDLPEKIHLPFPLIVKPLDEHSSTYLLQTSVVHNKRELKRELSSYATVKDQVIIESFIDGQEFCVPVVGTKSPLVLPVCAVFFTKSFFGTPRFLSYEAKHGTKKKCSYQCRSFPVHNLDTKLQKRMEALALQIYQSMDFRGYASIDMRVDQKGNIFVLDVNPNCDLAYDSDISLGAFRAGIPYSELINLIFFDKPVTDFFDGDFFNKK